MPVNWDEYKPVAEPKQSIVDWSQFKPVDSGGTDWSKFSPVESQTATNLAEEQLQTAQKAWGTLAIGTLAGAETTKREFQQATLAQATGSQLPPEMVVKAAQIAPQMHALETRRQVQTKALDKLPQFRAESAAISQKFDALMGLAGDDPTRRANVANARRMAEDDLNARASAQGVPFAILNKGPGEGHLLGEPVTREEMQSLFPNEPKLVRDIHGAANNVVSGLADMFQDPMVAAGIGTAKIAPQMAKAIGIAFGLQMVATAPEQAVKIYDAYKQGDRQEVFTGLGNLGVTAFLAPKLLQTGGMIESTPAEKIGEVATLWADEFKTRTRTGEAQAKALAGTIPPESQTLAPLTTAETSKTTEVPNAETIRENQGELLTERQVAQESQGVGGADVERPAPEQPQPVEPGKETQTLTPITDSAVKETPSPQVQTGGIAQPPPPPPAQPVGTEAGKALSSTEKPAEIVINNATSTEKWGGKLPTGTIDVGTPIYGVQGDVYGGYLHGAFSGEGEPFVLQISGSPKNFASDLGIPIENVSEGYLKPSTKIKVTGKSREKIGNKEIWVVRAKVIEYPTPEPPASQKPPELKTPKEAITESETDPMSVMRAQLAAAREAIKQGKPISGELARSYEILPELVKAGARYKYDAATDTFVPAQERMTVPKKAWSIIAKLDALDIRQRTEGESDAMGLERQTLTEKLAKEMGFTKEAKQKPAPPAPTSEGNDLGPGLGAAKTGEVEVQGNPDIYGIANRVEAERAMALGVEPPPPGKGIAPVDSVEHGRELLKQGRSAEGTLELFNKTKALSSEDVAVVRAHGEDLALAARRAEERFGTDSDEYRTALKASTDWDARIQPMKTEWNKSGMAMQGETDIDTGSFTGLARAHKRNTGEDFTPKQTKKAKEVSGKVRSAAEKAEEAKQNLFKDIDERTNLTAAEKRALDAANKTVRENSIRVAEAENKTRVAATELERETAKIQEAAARKALKDAEDVAKAAAVKLAKAETKAREQRAAERPEAIQNKAAQDALKAANETVRKAAADLAKEENNARVAKTVAEKDLANVAIKRAKQRLKEEQKRVRQAAIAAAKAEVKNRISPELKVWEQIRKYIDQGEFDFDEVRNKVATDLGMSVEQVTKLLTKTPRTKFLANEMWRRQQDYARFKESAKAWLRGVETPEYHKWIGSIPKVLFSLKVGFHGTVALGTHAPMVAFQPRFWKTYADNFLKMYHMVGSRAYHERQVQDLLRRKNYVTARRAGLVNDPSIFEDYNSPEVVKFLFTKLGDMGNRGYSILKILRQDMFDQMWDQLPQTTKTPEVAKAIADGLNHATGVVQVSAPKAAAVALFAPRLLGSRVMWLAGDPIRAADTMFRWKDATQAEKIFALNQVKEKLWVSGVMFTMLAINEGILNAVGSKQQVNFTDPFESDFLKFKAAGMNVSYGNAMITMARLPLQLWVGLKNEGKFNKITYEDENTAKTLFKYARSQASPFMALMLDLAFGRDYQERPLPRAGFGLLEGKKNVPKRLKAHGMGEPYTWPEYWSEQLSPIPFQEAIKEVWKTGLGMSDEQMTQFAKAMVTIAVMGGTGARVSEDYGPAKPTGIPPTPK